MEREKGKFFWLPFGTLIATYANAHRKKGTKAIGPEKVSPYHAAEKKKQDETEVIRDKKLFLATMKRLFIDEPQGKGRHEKATIRD